MKESVTQVLSIYQDWSQVRPDVLEAAGARGEDTHRICAGIAKGIWIPQVPAYLEGRILSYRKWFDAVVERVIFVEQEFYCDCFDFVGHPDLGVVIKGDKGITIPDLKTPATQNKVWRGQLGAYWHLVDKHGGFDLPVIRSGSLMLDPNGKTARLVEYTENSAADFNAYIAALTAYLTLKENEPMKFMKSLDDVQESPASPPAPRGEYDLEPIKKAVGEYLGQMEEILKAAERFVVSDDASLKEVVELGARSAKLVKALTTDRQNRTQKERDFVRDTDKLYKPLTVMGEKIKKICSEKHAQYQAKVRIEEQKRQKAAEEAQRELQKKLDAEAKKAGVEPVQASPIDIPRAPAVTRAESGSAHTRKIWVWELEDFSKVSDEFKSLNEVALNKAIRAGIRSLDGIRIFEKETTQFRT